MYRSPLKALFTIINQICHINANTSEGVRLCPSKHCVINATIAMTDDISGDDALYETTTTLYTTTTNQADLL